MNPQSVLLLLLVVVPYASAATCGSHQFACANQQKCIHASERCDGYKDCSDGSDEQCTGRKCANYEFTCANGKCLTKWKRCRGRNYCGDGSDDEQCRYIDAQAQ
ncbi:very low-density lipoprotein receptor-like [Stylophora pistillata]|uniref:very low-density lipoprotein receptor-like n=1 Tax=Stylophora pistillata TaxID=50429 RepID=UPI000C040EDC|nr:very low-density lipoprotein receptor-like [Stylophora pistillata]